MQYLREREYIVKVAKSLFDRRLTDAAGGNISLKMAKGIYRMTPTLASSKYLWNLQLLQILVVNQDLTILEGHGRLTREINMHMEVYRADPRINAVIHGHPRDTMVY